MRMFGFAAVVAGLAASLVGQRGDGASGPELTHFTLQEVELPIPEGGTARALVYLPVDYAEAAAEGTRYPWVVWLHGRNESHRKFHAEGGGLALDAARADDAIPAVIFVSLGVGRRPLYIDGGPDGDQEKLVVEALPRFLAEHYAVDPAARRRAIMGVSMGGFGALKIAMRHPGVFGIVAAHSSAIMPADPSALEGRRGRMVQRLIQSSGLDEVFGDPIEPAKWAAEMPLALARDLASEALAPLRMYFDAGTADRYGFTPANQELAEVLTERGVAHEFVLVDGGGHSWGSGSLQRQLPRSLAFVGAALRATSEAPPTETDGGR